MDLRVTEVDMKALEEIGSYSKEQISALKKQGGPKWDGLLLRGAFYGAYEYTPIPVLEKLARWDEKIVRASVAENKNIPVRLLEILSKDKENMVKEAVAKNPKASTTIKEAFEEESLRKIFEFEL